jgi:hypothetical protein
LKRDLAAAALDSCFPLPLSCDLLERPKFIMGGSDEQKFSIDLSKLDENIKAANLEYSQRAFLLPGEYRLAVAILDTATGEHSTRQAQFRVAPRQHDSRAPLIPTWSPAIYPTVAWVIVGDLPRLYLVLGTRHKSGIATYPANLCPLSERAEFAGFREYLGQPIRKAVEAVFRRSVGQGPAEHLDRVLSKEQRVNNAIQAGTERNPRRVRLRDQMSRLRAGQTELALQVTGSNLDVMRSSCLSLSSEFCVTP